MRSIPGRWSQNLFQTFTLREKSLTLTVCVAVTIYSGHGRVVMLPAGMRQNDTGHISLCGVQNNGCVKDL